MGKRLRNTDLRDRLSVIDVMQLGEKGFSACHENVTEGREPSAFLENPKST